MFRSSFSKGSQAYRAGTRRVSYQHPANKMKAQIENLKQELREFIELSRTITEREWEPSQETVWSGGVRVCAYTEEVDATFIARSRNISPAMAECLLIAATMIEAMSIEVNVECSDEALNAYAQDSRLAQDTLQQILTVWEETK